MKGTLGAYAIVAVGFLILLAIGLPGLIIYHFNKARRRRDAKTNGTRND